MDRKDEQLDDYVVVIRSGSTLRYLPDERHVITGNINGQDVTFTFQTFYKDEGFEHPIPRGLWIDARGKARSLKEAITTFTNTALYLTTLLSFCGNGYTGECEFHLAYNNTPGLPEREFFEQFLEDERGLPLPKRKINIPVFSEVLETLSKHRHTDRLRRAIVQYVLALSYWKRGNEILSVAHLYMGFEALVVVVREIDMEKRGLTTLQDLANALNIKKEELDSTLRRMRLFKEDMECHRAAKRISDGMEHGFTGFDEILPLAIQYRDQIAQYLRAAIVELLGVPEETTKTLLSKPYDQPIGINGYIRYFWGRLLAESENLAPEGRAYPFFDWRFKVNSYNFNDLAELKISFGSQLTAQLGNNVQFIADRFELFGPEGFVRTSPIPEEPIQLEVIPAPTELKSVSESEIEAELEKALREGVIEEIKIRNKDGSILVVSRTEK